MCQNISMADKISHWSGRDNYDYLYFVAGKKYNGKCDGWKESLGTKNTHHWSLNILSITRLNFQYTKTALVLDCGNVSPGIGTLLTMWRYFIIIWIISSVIGKKPDVLRRNDMNHLEQFIPEDYDKSLPPWGSGIPDEPYTIAFFMKARELQKVDEQNMEITVLWYIRSFWYDHRLNTPNETYPDGLIVDPRIISYLWTPISFIDNAVEITAPTLTVVPRYVALGPNGRVWYSSAKITRLSCPMDFSAYPFDTQECLIKIEDYQLHSKYLIYAWHKPIEIGSMPKNPQFTIAFETIDSILETHAGEAYASLTGKIILRRSITNHLMNTYFPSSLLVAVSWLSFLVPPTQVPGRMILSITTLLTLMAMFSAVRNQGPQVSYAKALDQWMLGCLLFVFLVLIEFTSVLFLLSKDDTKTIKVTPVDNNFSGMKVRTPQKEPTGLTRMQQARNLDKWSLFILMLAFVGFTIIYWAHWYKSAL